MQGRVPCGRFFFLPSSPPALCLCLSRFFLPGPGDPLTTSNPTTFLSRRAVGTTEIPVAGVDVAPLGQGRKPSLRHRVFFASDSSINGYLPNALFRRRSRPPTPGTGRRFRVVWSRKVDEKKKLNIAEQLAPVVGSAGAFRGRNFVPPTLRGWELFMRQPKSGGDYTLVSGIPNSVRTPPRSFAEKSATRKTQGFVLQRRQASWFAIYMRFCGLAFLTPASSFGSGSTVQLPLVFSPIR